MYLSSIVSHDIGSKAKGIVGNAHGGLPRASVSLMHLLVIVLFLRVLLLLI